MRLTLLAKENIVAAPGIVCVIAEHVRKVAPGQRLPAFFLIDSIIKNFVDPYVRLFSQELLKLFALAYAEASNEDKVSLWRLLQSWRSSVNGPLIPLQLILQMEESVALINSHIYKDPRVQHGPSFAPVGPPPSIQEYARVPNLKPVAFKVCILIFRSLSSQDSHTDLSPKSLGARVRALLSQKQAMRMYNTNDATLETQIHVLEQLLQLVANITFDSNIAMQISDQLRVLESFSSENAQMLPWDPMDNTRLLKAKPQAPIREADHWNDPSAHFNFQMPLAINQPVDTRREAERQEQQFVIPKIALTNKDVNNSSHPNAYELLYRALKLQCKQCGFRFHQDENGKRKMAVHLDWHFRQNRRSKEKAIRLFSRDLFVGYEDWIFGREIDSAQEVDESKVFFETMEAVKEDSPAEVVICEGSGEYKCEICRDPIEKVYDDDMEDWVLKSATKVDSLIYHSICYSAARANI